MIIGIDASRAFLDERTGIEEYAYQIITRLSKKLDEHQVVLYLRKGQLKKVKKLPVGLEIKEIPFFRYWTQIGLSWEMLTNPVDVLFVPAHTVPFVHPCRTIVTIHGLEYEHCAGSYSFCSRLFHRFFIKKSCRWADKIIAVSKRTKDDLAGMYKVPEEKIGIVYNGFENNNSANLPESENTKLDPKVKDLINQKFLLYIGRLEERKNLKGIIGAFEILNEKYAYSGNLVLAGRSGYGYKKVKSQKSKVKSSKKIFELGYVSGKEKQQLLERADVFLFPSFCEGFGIPILEAQNAGTPVVTSNIGPMDEVAGDENILIDPFNSEEIARLANKLMTDKDFRQEVVQKGRLNVQKFSWEKSAEETEEVILNYSN